jgi:hypothetical protein
MAMANEVSTLQSVQDNIKSRIKAEFVNLIPDEMWSRMVAEVVSDFTKDRIENPNSYSARRQEAPIKMLIREQIEAIAKTHIMANLDELTRAHWDSHGQLVASEALKKMIAEHFPVILASIQAGFTEMIVQNAVNHIRNSMQR